MEDKLVKQINIKEDTKRFTEELAKKAVSKIATLRLLL